jgi:hypothetical protein
MSDNTDENIENGKYCSQFSIYFERHVAFRKADESLVCSKKLGSFFKPTILRSKRSATSESSIDELICCLYMVFK